MALRKGGFFHLTILVSIRVIMKKIAKAEVGNIIKIKQYKKILNKEGILLSFVLFIILLFLYQSNNKSHLKINPVIEKRYDFNQIVCGKKYIDIIQTYHLQKDKKESIGSYISQTYKKNQKNINSTLTSLYAIGKYYGIPLSLSLSLIEHESRFNNEVTSSKGAIGFMQVMPRTALGISELEHLDCVNEDNINKLLREPNINFIYGHYILKYAVILNPADANGLIGYSGYKTKKLQKKFIDDINNRKSFYESM
ncbi:Slt70_like domain containing protein [Candidatus Methylopumilus universalis]|uniref:transglycosylase SLT domain-containing protein n=1 Tax=Candidatus Methylopumilus universalis TaxID=2588536 RepID=UPI003BEED5A7